MLVIVSPRARFQIGALWLVFASINAYLMYHVPGRETIPYHLIWASFALLYGLAVWSIRTTYVVFTAITVATGIPLIRHAKAGYIGWEECSEIVLMAVIAGLLVWHVRRGQAARARILAMRDAERAGAARRETATRCASHELRTRLTIARGLTDLIRAQATDSEVRSEAELAITELDKATAATTNLVTLFRMECLPGSRQEVDVDDLVAGVSRRWAIREDRIWRFHAAAGTVSGDPERLEAAMDCLIENAVKFTAEDDDIRLEAVVAPDDAGVVLLSVQDSGIGIPGRDLTRVTELFSTSEAAGDQAGSGLGLAIVRQITESHGGTVLIESELGRGTKVTLRLPRRVSAAARHAARMRPVLSPFPVPAAAGGRPAPEPSI
jgi:signal transduction histidine kinase